MKRPKERGEDISLERVAHWLDEFGSYRHQVTERKFEKWVGQFDPSHQDIAARVIDCIDFVGFPQISKIFQSILKAIPGWDINPGKRKGNWRFVAYSGSAGESGDTMLHLFRLANNLDSKAHNELFITRSDLVRANLTADDTVVFLDDFSGTGDTVCNSWRQTFQELLYNKPRTFLVLVAASQSAFQRIRQETDLLPICAIKLSEKDNFFNAACKYFTDEEKKAVLKYCEVADSRNPKGYGECGFVIVFAHRCPNNTIPILHVSHRKWFGLFQRHD